LVAVDFTIDNLDIMNIRKIKDTTEEYLSQTDYEGSTTIKNAIKSDQDYIWFRKSKKSTDAQEFGTAVHMAILEPDLFEKTYFVFDDEEIVAKLIGGGSKSPRATKEYKEWVEAEMQRHSGRVSIGKQEMESFLVVQKRLQQDSRYHQMIVPQEKETSFYVDNFYEGIGVKIRPDCASNGLPEVDIKTTKDVTPIGFKREFFKYGYDIQRALYLDVLTEYGYVVPESIILAIGNQPPFLHEFYHIPKDWIIAAREKYKYGLQQIKRMREGKYYDGYAHKFMTTASGCIDLSSANYE